MQVGPDQPRLLSPPLPCQRQPPQTGWNQIRWDTEQFMRGFFSRLFKAGRQHRLLGVETKTSVLASKPISHTHTQQVVIKNPLSLSSPTLLSSYRKPCVQIYFPYPYTEGVEAIIINHDQYDYKHHWHHQNHRWHSHHSFFFRRNHRLSSSLSSLATIHRGRVFI